MTNNTTNSRQFQRKRLCIDVRKIEDKSGHSKMKIWSCFRQEGNHKRNVCRYLPDFRDARPDIVNMRHVGESSRCCNMATNLKLPKTIGNGHRRQKTVSDLFIESFQGKMS